ncbi:hypothetical protein DFH29DRAFT_1014016 [Suillus ampliporus]|nr:hypothetical protein DFH29DRAFT_1014016 [Suillus ampliporus]
MDLGDGAHPCDPEGNFLPPGTPPPPLTDKTTDDWTPYKSRVEFELADYLFTRNQTPAHSIDHLLDIWAASLMQAGSKATLFSDYCDIYKTIDNTPLGDVRWQSFTVKYTGEIPEEGAAPWMADSHEVWFRDPHKVVRNMLANPDFAAEIDLRPYHEFAMENDEQPVEGLYVRQIGLIIKRYLQRDKTTTTPLYASIGNVQNNVRRAHQNAVAVVGFLTMPKTTKQHAETDFFWRFHRQLFHSSLSFILKNLRPAMTKPEVVHFRDGHYRRVVYGLGPYIADYEEQVVLACIVRRWCAKCLSHRKNLDETSLPRSRLHVDTLIEECDFDTLWVQYGIPFTNDFPRADIHELLAPNLLHQIIKGAFKDHLVEWVEKYLIQVHGKTQANIILDDIDRRIAVVYLPAIKGYVPEDVMRMFSAFLEFCYLVRRNVITETSLEAIHDALTRFHRHREIFKTTGTIPTFSLPQQHSMSHYVHLIQSFGAPNGLCSSITELKHIKAVKEPWRRSSWYNALGQMLLINQRLDKLAASRVDFHTRRMLSGTCLSSVLAALEPSANVPAQAVQPLPTSAEGHNPSQQELPAVHQTASILDVDVAADSEDIDAPTSILAHVQLARTSQGKKCAQTIPALADELVILDLADLVQDFLIEQLYLELDPAEVPENIMDCPHYEGRIRVFNSAVSTFFAPSDLSGIGGMKREYIHVSPNWRQGHARKDCVFVITDPNAHGMLVVRWFNRVSDTPDDETGLWMVEPSSIENRTHFAVIHVESIFRSAHLIPVYGTEPLPSVIKFHHTLDIFTLFYVNKYANHHAFEIAS